MAQYKIIIDHTKVSADLTDFPVYVDLANFPQDFWDTVSEGGGDIRCYDVLDNELAREVVSCNTTLKSGELHIKANLSSSVSTILKVGIDGTSPDYNPSDAYGRNAVWSNGYIGVWHLGSLTDSTGIGYDLTNNDTVTAEGILNTSRSGFNAGKYLTAGSPPGLYRDNMTWTISAWSNPADTSRTIQYVVDHGFSAVTGLGIYMRYGVWSAHGRGEFRSNITATPGTWTHLVATSSYTLYINGTDAEAEFMGDGGGATSPPFDFRIGYQSKNSQSPTTRFFSGDIDEVRLSEYVRAPEWIATEYANQSSPTTFYTIEGIVQQPIPFSDGYAYIYANVGYSAPNSGQGYGYSYENIGYSAPNSGNGYGYSYENVGYSAPNSGVGYGYSYENVTLYVIDNNNMLPPIIS